MLSENTTRDDGVRYFFLRDRGGAPIGVVALERRGDAVLVGTSLCARSDAWDRDKGKMIARGRAQHERSALATTATGCRIPLRTIVSFQCGDAARLRDVDFDTACRVFDSMVAHMLTRSS